MLHFWIKMLTLFVKKKSTNDLAETPCNVLITTCTVWNRQSHYVNSCALLFLLSVFFSDLIKDFYEHIHIIIRNSLVQNDILKEVVFRQFFTSFWEKISVTSIHIVVQLGVVKIALICKNSILRHFCPNSLVKPSPVVQMYQVDVHIRESRPHTRSFSHETRVQPSFSYILCKHAF